MAAETPKTIVLRGSPLRKEGVASSAITPGMLVEFGGVNDLQAHSTAGGNARKAFALEWDPANDIDDAYAQGAQVMYGIFHRGDEAYALLKAGKKTTAIGDPLESAGDGSLQPHASPVIDEDGSAEKTINLDAVVCYALEVIDNEAGQTAVRIRVEVA